MPSRQPSDERRIQNNRFQKQFVDYFKKGNDAMGPVSNPRYDYSFNFIETGEYPQNFVLNDSQTERYRRYPKMDNFITKKRQHIDSTNHPAMFLKCNPLKLAPVDLKSHFDVILVEPPLLDYKINAGVNHSKYWSWDEIEQLPVDQLAAPRSFVWLWCGSIEGLNRGRECLKKWGFRRCEDICWIKTNKFDHKKKNILEHGAIFHRTKEHCLMGIRGTVKRSLDGDFIHANVDVDVILAEEDPDLPDKKPDEMFSIIENFCLGRRRLHIFGRDHSVRPGWLTVGPDLTLSNFDVEQFSRFFNHSASGHLTGTTTEIESMRPKSPPPKEIKQVMPANVTSTGAVSVDPQVRTSIGSNPVSGSIQQLPLHSFQLAPPYLMSHQQQQNVLVQHRQLEGPAIVPNATSPQQCANAVHLNQDGSITLKQNVSIIHQQNVGAMIQQQQLSFVLLPQQNGNVTQQQSQRHLDVRWQAR